MMCPGDSKGHCKTIRTDVQLLEVSPAVDGS